jgi:hypothetical protein
MELPSFLKAKNNMRNVIIITALEVLVTGTGVAGVQAQERGSPAMTQLVHQNADSITRGAYDRAMAGDGLPPTAYSHALR